MFFSLEASTRALKNRKGQPGRFCERCGLEIPEQGIRSDLPEDQSSRTRPVCPGCGRRLAPEFQFCPYCGRPLN